MDELKEQIKELTKELREIRENHLSHIYKELVFLKTESVKSNVNQKWLISIVTAILLGIIAYYFK